VRINTVECIAGTTIKLTWVSSGAAPAAITSGLITGSETALASVAAIDSGNGHFYAYMTTPSSGGWYVNKWIALVGANTWISAQLVHAKRLEVD